MEKIEPFSIENFNVFIQRYKKNDKLDCQPVPENLLSNGIHLSGKEEKDQGEVRQHNTEMKRKQGKSFISC